MRPERIGDRRGVRDDPEDQRAEVRHARPVVVRVGYLGNVVPCLARGDDEWPAIHGGLEVFLAGVDLLGGEILEDVRGEGLVFVGPDGHEGREEMSFFIGALCLYAN